MTRGDAAAATGARRKFLRSVVGRAFAQGLVIVAVCGPAVAAPPSLQPLLEPLRLVGYRVGKVPPHFAGNTLDGRSISVSDLRGSVVMVNFWASWCAECRPEMPVLERLHREFAAQGLSVVGVNAREGKETVGGYARALGLTFPLVLDLNGEINALYGVIGLPTTFLVARDGRAVALAVGTRDWGSASARALIQRLLAETAQTPTAGVR
jgi:thiol-disulfide isomerase/thioredoxin